MCSQSRTESGGREQRFTIVFLVNSYRDRHPKIPQRGFAENVAPYCDLSRAQPAKRPKKDTTTCQNSRRIERLAQTLTGSRYYLCRLIPTASDARMLSGPSSAADTEQGRTYPFWPPRSPRARCERQSSVSRLTYLRQFLSSNRPIAEQVALVAGPGDDVGQRVRFHPRAALPHEVSHRSSPSGTRPRPLQGGGEHDRRQAVSFRRVSLR